MLGDRYSEQPRQWSSSGGSSSSSSHRRNQYKYDEDQRFNSQGKGFKDDEPDESTTTTTYVDKCIVCHLVAIVYIVVAV